MSDRPVIALIEDDPLFRVPLARGLDDAGFTVVAAASGPEGVALLEDPTIDVAVIDVKLPRIDGLQVLAEARRGNPGLKSILISGIRPREISRAERFLAKPFRLDDLIQALNETLGIGRRFAPRI